MPPRELTIPAPLLEFRGDAALSPGMHAVVLRLGHEVDQRRFEGPVSDAVWFTIPTRELRGARTDNQRLRGWLRNLMRVELEGEFRGDPWGAVLVAEFHIEDDGGRVRVLVPPAAVNALRSPETFAKVEMEAAHRLRGAARRLYLALADKKRLSRRWWQYELGELRRLLDADHKSYQQFKLFRQRVLDPAVARINDFGTVHVTMTPVRDGRPVAAVRFDWRWKTLDEAMEASEENDRHTSVRRKPVDGPREAPPLVEGASVARTRSPEEKRAELERVGALEYTRDRGVPPLGR